MKLDKTKHKPLNKSNIITTKMVQEDYKNAWIDLDERFIDYEILESAFDGLKAIIEDSYAQELPIDEEYICNCLDFWLGEIFVE